MCGWSQDFFWLGISDSVVGRLAKSRGDAGFPEVALEENFDGGCERDSEESA